MSANYERLKRRRVSEPWIRLYEDARWRQARERARERDGQRCSHPACSLSQSRLEVHHLVPVRTIWFTSATFEEFVTRATDIEIIVTLCKGHHMIADAEQRWLEDLPAVDLVAEDLGRIDLEVAVAREEQRRAREEWRAGAPDRERLRAEASARNAARVAATRARAAEREAIWQARRNEVRVLRSQGLGYKRIAKALGVERTTARRLVRMYA
jgi:hypothetical protein